MRNPVQTQSSARPNDSYLSADVLLMGGLSVMALMCSWMFMDKASSLVTVSQFAFAAAFICNHPHFLSSYTLLYGDYRQRILTNKSYLWAAVVVPLVLGGLICTAVARLDGRLMAHIITGMYFLVGWHYVKQIFGCVIVTSVQRKIFYKPWQRKMLLFNLFSTWFISWLRSHVLQNDFTFYGISHYSLKLPYWTLETAMFLCGASFAAIVWMHVKMYVESGTKPSPPGVAAFVAIYAWYLPVTQHSGFGYMIPFFHSLQYLVFVWSLKKNEVEHGIRALNDRAARDAWVRRFLGYAAGVLVLGALCFEFIPNFLDAQGWIPPGSLGTNPFLAAVLLFINIHHYFIDNVIWRSDNPTVRAFLFRTDAPPAEAMERAAPKAA